MRFKILDPFSDHIGKQQCWARRVCLHSLTCKNGAMAAVEDRHLLWVDIPAADDTDPSAVSTNKLAMMHVTTRVRRIMYHAATLYVSVACSYSVKSSLSTINEALLTQSESVANRLHERKLISQHGCTLACRH